MKVKLAVIFQAQDVVKKLVNLPMPAKNAFKVSRFARVFTDILQDIEKQRAKLIEKFGKAEGNGFRVTEENNEKFFKEFGELMEQDVEFKEAALNLAVLDGVSLSAAEMNMLQTLVEE